MRDPTRIDLLFTMSEITHEAILVRMHNMRSDVSRTMIWIRKRVDLRSSGGARRDRTDDLMLAKHALSQLSYGPVTRRRMLHVKVAKVLSARLRPFGLRRARFAFLCAWLRHAEPKAKRGGPGKI